jgi:hypothetical protein
MNKTTPNYKDKNTMNTNFIFLHNLTGNAFKTGGDRLNDDDDYDFHYSDQIEEFAPVLAAKQAISWNDYVGLRNQLIREICKYWNWNVKLMNQDVRKDLNNAVIEWKNRPSNHKFQGKVVNGYIVYK